MEMAKKRRKRARSPDWIFIIGTSYVRSFKFQFIVLLAQ